MNAWTPLEWLGSGAALVYAVALVLLALYAGHSLVLLRLFLRHRRAAQAQEAAELATPLPDGRPHVLVQVPVYNERDVVARCVAAVGALRWPRERLTIQLLDDGDDDSVGLGAAAIDALRARGLDAAHVRREHRTGFKAGALEYGMSLCPQAEYTAIFDADFLPHADFLERAIRPLLADPGLALVQGRWEHHNPDANLLTRAQAIGIDGHFAVEQGARAWGGLLMNFNGTAGLWRTAAIHQGGGWQHDTLTEDLDLSYRVQLAGWRCTYRLGLAVPAELPADVHAWRSQQFRWAKGSQQCTRKLMPRIWGSDIGLGSKVAAFLHLSHYAVHPLMAASLLAAPLALGFAPSPPLWVVLVGVLFFVFGIGAPIATYAVSQAVLGRSLVRFLRVFPILAGIGTGIALSNTRAVGEAWRGLVSPFVRTPKSGAGSGSYRAQAESGVPEIIAGLWASTGVLLALHGQRAWALPLLLIYTSGFLTVGGLCLRGWLPGRVGSGGWPWPLLAAGAVALTGTLGLALHPGQWQQAPIWYAAWGAVLGAGFLAAAVLAPRMPAGWRTAAVVVAVTIALRVAAWGIAPSDDLNRYVVEGAQVASGENPYAVPPAAASPTVQHAVAVDIHAAVNHPQWTAIYPPLALLAQAAAVEVSASIAAQRVLMLAAEALALAALAALLLRRGRSSAWLVLAAWNPVAVIWLAGEGHNDALMLAALALALWAWDAGHRTGGVVAASVAALCKPFAVLALAPRLIGAPRYHWMLCLGIAVLAYLPFVGAGWGLVDSLGRFGAEKAFNGVLQPLVDAGLRNAGVAAMYARTATALVLAGLFVGGAALILFRHRRGLARIGPGDDLQAIGKLLVWLLICLPTLHPWYLAMLLPFLPLFPGTVRLALVLWCALMPLHALHGLAMDGGARWEAVEWVTGSIHLLPMSILGWVVWRRSRPWRLRRLTAAPALAGTGAGTRE
jgi:cellulose synthase/poly-beta-1,6-N-acetylglucosamine synthase-like glycosyltransferase